MARIRTIKPELWADEKIGRLKRDCRLLFIGLWSFSDDYGTVRSNPIWIKSQVFPYDEDLRIDVLVKWLAALVDARMLEPFEYNSEGFYNIRTFLSHQKVDKPSRPIIPKEEKQRLFEGSGSTRGTLGEYSALEVVSSNRKEEGEGDAHEENSKTFPRKPKSEDIPDPEDYIIQIAFEAQHRIGNKEISKKQISEYFNTWKAIEYNGEKHSPGLSDIYKHFALHCNKSRINIGPPKPPTPPSPNSYKNL